MKVLFEQSLSFGTYQVFDSRPDFSFKKVVQVHGDIIVNLEQNPDPKKCEADGIVAPLNYDIPLVIVTADCLPVVIKGKKGVGFFHAGWRGLQSKILQSPEISRLEPSEAFIGPHICARHYQVTSEFKDYFPGSSALIEKEGHLYFDLGQEAENQLAAAHPGIAVSKTAVCTFESPDLFSFRQNQTIERNWNVFFYSK